jgi:CheY-like chemotaxis protein
MEQKTALLPNVLAVVNDLFFRVKLESPAKQAGWQITFATNSEQALAEAGKKPDLILLDLNLQGADSLAILRALRNDEAARTVPVVAYVSHVQVTLRQQAEAAGCAQVLPRSVISERLPQIFAEYRPDR